MVKQYGTIKCKDCSQDLTNKAQYYEYVDKEKTKKVVYCELCNYRRK